MNLLHWICFITLKLYCSKSVKEGTRLWTVVIFNFDSFEPTAENLILKSQSKFRFCKATKKFSGIVCYIGKIRSRREEKNKQQNKILTWESNLLTSKTPVRISSIRVSIDVSIIIVNYEFPNIAISSLNSNLLSQISRKVNIGFIRPNFLQGFFQNSTCQDFFRQFIAQKFTFF